MGQKFGSAVNKKNRSFMGPGLKSMIDAALLAALADGEADDDEVWGAVEALRGLGEPFESLSDEEFESLVQESVERLDGYDDMESQIEAVAGQLARNPDHAASGYAVAYIAVWANHLEDEAIDDDDQEFLDQFAEALGLSEDQVEEITSEVDATYYESDEGDEEDEDSDDEDEDSEDEEEEAEEAVAPKPTKKPADRPAPRAKPAEEAPKKDRPKLRPEGEDRPKKKPADDGPGLGAVAAGVAAAGVAAAGVAAAVASARSEDRPKKKPPVAEAAPVVQVYTFSGATPLDAALREFGPDDYTVKLTGALIGAIPVELPLATYATIEQAVGALAPDASHDARSKAEAFAHGDPAATGLKILGAIDMADTGISVFSGLKSVFGLLSGGGSASLETDTQQGADAAIKLLALAYFIHSVYPGDLTDKVKLFYATPSGKALLTYYAAVEIGLPFADNALVGTGNIVSDLYGKHGGAAAEKLNGLLPAGAVAAAQGMMGSLLAPVEGIVQRVAPHAKAAAQAASGFLPTAMSVLDKAAGAVATGADAMPVYKYLGARVLTEVAVLHSADRLKGVELPGAPAAASGSSIGAMLSSAAPIVAGVAAAGATAAGAVIAARSLTGDGAPDTLEGALAEFGPTDLTVKLCSTLLTRLPGVPAQIPFASLPQAFDALYPAGDATVRARATALSQGEAVTTGLKIVRAVDMADAGISVFSGLKSAVGLARGEGMGALETDTQQGVDAIVKLLGLAYFIHTVYPGTIAEKMQLFYTTPTGQALITYYAAVEVAMPFADNALVGTGNFVSGLYSQYGGTAAEKLGGLLPAGAVAAAQGMMGSLLAPVDGIVQRVAPHAKAAAQAVSGALPGAMDALDKAAGAAATALDALPVYKYLGARVLAESCVLLASRGL